MITPISDEFSEYANNYLESLKHPLRNIIKDNEYFVKVKADIIIEKIRSHFSERKMVNIVDVGTGIGIFEKYLCSDKVNLLGVDLSFRMLQVAQKINPIEIGGYCQANALDLPFPNDYADIVFSSCVLHHISNEARVLLINDMRRICKPGGVIMIFEHNPYNLLTQLVVKTTPLDRNARLVPDKSLSSIFNKSEYIAFERSYFLYGFLKIDEFINSKIKKLTHFPLGGQYYISAIKGSK